MWYHKAAVFGMALVSVGAARWSVTATFHYCWQHAAKTKPLLLQEHDVVPLVSFCFQAFNLFTLSATKHCTFRFWQAGGCWRMNALKHSTFTSKLRGLTHSLPPCLSSTSPLCSLETARTPWSRCRATWSERHAEWTRHATCPQCCGNLQASAFQRSLYSPSRRQLLRLSRLTVGEFETHGMAAIALSREAAVPEPVAGEARLQLVWWCFSAPFSPFLLKK